MFAEIVKLKVGDQAVNIRRLTVGEIREARGRFSGGEVTLDDSYDKLIHDHVTLEDGTPVNTADLSLKQMQEIVGELVGLPDGRSIADFIRLLY